jgi:hypothetical protein
VYIAQGQPQATFNLSVDGSPNYYVGSGVLVHNETPPAGPRFYSFGDITVYEGYYDGPDAALSAKFKNHVYVGQTDQGIKVRENGHHAEAAKELRRTNLSPAEREFFEFKRHMKLRARVTGLDAVQADYIEQLNLNIEREVPGQKVMYRREQAVPRRFRELAEIIRNDPQVKAAGLCPP